jgi:hypothetical protein
MLLNTLVSASFVALAATGSVPDSPGAVKLSNAEKAAVVQRVVNHATDCVVRQIEASDKTLESLGEQIVAAMPPCAATMRAMIDSFDANYGEGTGEAFFTGSFLDVLPQVVSKRLLQGDK